MCSQVRFCQVLAFPQSLEQPEHFCLCDTLHSSHLKVQKRSYVGRPDLFAFSKMFHLLVMLVEICAPLLGNTYKKKKPKNDLNICCPAGVTEVLYVPMIHICFWRTKFTVLQRSRKMEECDGSKTCSSASFSGDHFSTEGMKKCIMQPVSKGRFQV